MSRALKNNANQNPNTLPILNGIFSPFDFSMRRYALLQQSNHLMLTDISQSYLVVNILETVYKIINK